MSAGGYGTDPDQPGSYSQPGVPPPPPPYAQAGQYGQPVSPQYRYEYAVPMRRTNALAVAALSCGIGQVIAGPFAGVPAIILGAMSLKQIRESGEEGHAMAVVGLVLGIVGVVLFVLAIVGFAVFADWVVHSGTSTGGPATGTG